MRRVAFLLATWFTLSSVAAPTEAAPRPARPSKAKSDGVWYKGDGWGGYGWYSIYGDFVGTDGYTYIANRYPSPANPRGWFLGPMPILGSGYRP
jgi:hypothetical protein